MKTEAVRAVGKAGGAASVEFLRQAASVPSHRGMVGNAASEAPKALGQR